MIKEINNISTNVIQKEAGFLDRSLSSEIFGNLTQGDIKNQLIELKKFEDMKLESKNL